MTVPVVAVVGRPNVGKSALFNRLVGGNAAIVDDEAGTTRDRHFAKAEWAGREFWLVDTGGITGDVRSLIERDIERQVSQAVDEADLLLFVVDARAGRHPTDFHVADFLRQAGRPWLVVANKVDDPETSDHYDFYGLGAGEPIPVSALNGKGSGDLLDELVARLPAAGGEARAGSALGDGKGEGEAAKPSLSVAVIGRPNVGKSSLVNRLLGEERLVVSEAPGTTRDAVDTPMRYHGRELVFIDTAGLRRQSHMEDGVEFYSSLRSRRAIERADVCVLVVDASTMDQEAGGSAGGMIENQDLKIATLAWDAGCALIVVANKWDLAEKDEKASAALEKKSRDKAPFLRFVPFLFASARTGQRVTRLLDLILQVNDERHKRVTTSEVNARLSELVVRRQPPQSPGHEVKLNYATQVAVAPPTIAVFANRPDLVQEHYVRYLHNGFREFWGFKGSPLRILLRRKSGSNAN